MRKMRYISNGLGNSFDWDYEEDGVPNMQRYAAAGSCNSPRMAPPQQMMRPVTAPSGGGCGQRMTGGMMPGGMQPGMRQPGMMMGHRGGRFSEGIVCAGGCMPISELRRLAQEYAEQEAPPQKKKIVWW